MKCIHPRHKKYYDAYSGEEKVLTFPCGHCAACLHNIAESWSVRLIETAAHKPYFIYDTLTLRDENLEWIDVSDAFVNGFVQSNEEIAHHLFDSGYAHIPCCESYYDARVPFLSKSVVSDWVKRGRDAFRSFYHKSSKMRLFAVLEYGPKWSRPHVHLLAFDVEYADWVRFWAKPWRRDFGFTKTKCIYRGLNAGKKSRDCIAHYVTKYINKGAFDVPFVKAGLQPRPWRVISHGIGKEYLSSSRFDWLNTPLNFYLKFQVSRKPAFVFSVSDSCFYKVHIKQPVLKHNPNFSLTKSQLVSLTTYCDDSGFYHPLPRYYREKLLGREPNYLKYEIQTCLLQDAEQRRDQEISRIASVIERSRACESQPSSSLLGLPLCSRYLAAYIYDVTCENEARLAEKRCFDKLRNHYKRPLVYNSNSTSSFNRVLNC